MLKVTALTAFRSDPASRFRFRQFFGPLTKFGIDVTDRYLPISRYRRQPLTTLGLLLRLPGIAESRRSDITWFRRELIPERCTLERFTGGKRLFDVDDAIWLGSDKPFSERIVEMCDGVIAGNTFLADHYRPLGKPVWIVPTVVDTDVWKPAGKVDDGLWRIGWLGTRYNLRYLDMIERPLADFLGEHEDARLTIVSDGPPDFSLIPRKSIEYIRWSAEGEIDMTRRLDVGLMPAEDNDWARGKCALKMLCYLAVGVPAIVSPVGVNSDVLDLGKVGFGPTDANDWFEALSELYENRELAAKMGDDGRRIVEEHYSVHANVEKLADVFQTVADRTIA